MKATNPSESQKGSKRSLYRPAGSSRSETVAYAALGLAALVMVALALVSGSILAKPGEDPLVAYVRSGRLAADMRTATALVHYWFQAEPGARTTNVTQAGHTQRNLPMPTNHIDG